MSFSIRRDTSSIPKAITNSKGKLVLGYVNNGIDEHLDLGMSYRQNFYNDILQTVLCLLRTSARGGFRYYARLRTSSSA